MGGVIKYTPIIKADIKPYSYHFYLSIFTTSASSLLKYGCAFIFIAFTIFLAFTPSSNSPWFTNIFSTTTPTTSSSSSFSDQSYRSHFSPIYYYFFPNSSAGSQNTPIFSKNDQLPVLGNQTKDGHNKPSHKFGVFKPDNNTTDLPSINHDTHVINDTLSIPQPNPSSSSVLRNGSSNLNNKVEVLSPNQSTIGGVPNNTVKNASSTEKSSSGAEIKNLTSSLMKKKQNIGTNVKQQGIDLVDDDLIKSLKSCQLFDGNWVRDESYPLYKPGSCSLVDDQFNCFLNGRPDYAYHKLKWKPNGCTLPRLDGSHMLELLRGKRLVFVGDSLNRNMWESLICILRNSIKDHKKVYEEHGRHHFRTEASYSFVFEDYKCTVEFYVSPFLVREWEAADKNGTKKETLRLDMLGSSADKYKNADIIVFNTGHWWTHDKTSKGNDYYQEGSHVYSKLNVLEAFRKALTTWGRWVDANVNPTKSLVFFRGYSASHFSGGQWNSGGQCDHETEPIKNETYLSHYPSKMTVLERVLKGMKTRVSYLNITRMTDYRKDGHPSIYRRQHMSDEERRSPLSFQDCSHWCLPGVPDAWNEILYAQLLLKLYIPQ